METLRKPARLNLGPNSPSAAKEWKLWHMTFRNFIDECGENASNKFRTLVNYVSHNVYDYTEDCTDYDAAIETLTQLYIKTPNEIFPRYLLRLLAIRRQKPGETLTEFLQALRKLSKDCNLKKNTAEQYREELVRDTFINGIASPLIRQRLLENTRLDLKTAFDQANSLDLAQKNSEAYAMPSIPVTATVSSSPTNQHTEIPMPKEHSLAATYAPKKKCYFCGDSIHSRRRCPARDVETVGKRDILERYAGRNPMQVQRLQCSHLRFAQPQLRVQTAYHRLLRMYLSMEILCQHSSTREALIAS